ncbi:MAG: TRAP transporter substrate-binding protein DctP [Desulfobacterales bacterium]|nr:TRAP transporter substrate-binding protein DctP [Desulfobacterales bacterium]
MRVPSGIARRVGLLLFCLGLGMAAATASFAKTTLKVAVVIPEGSAWVKVLEEMVAEIRTRTQGELDFIIYPGGVSGDEADVLRKMQANRLQAAGLSGVGLGIVLPEIRVLESPLLWSGDDAVDMVRERMFDTFAAAFEKKGFTLLGFTEGGWVYLFSARDISRPEQFRSCKMWLWQGDRTAELFLNTSGVRTTPLHVADVNTGLETGMIDSFYAPPLAAVAFQWYVRVRYLLDLPITNATAALLMNKKSMEALPADHQKILRSVARQYCQKLVALTRRDNREAMAILKTQGLQVVTPTAELAREIEDNARKTYARSIPDPFPQALFEQVERIAIEARGAAKEKSGRN